MAFVEYNPNPEKKTVGDCVVRAISKLMGTDWETTYLKLSVQGLMMHDRAEANHVWGTFLFNNGYRRSIAPDFCPVCYTVKEFCKDNPKGAFLLALDGHVVTVIDGDYYDSWDSGDEVPLYFWRKEK